MSELVQQISRVLHRDAETIAGRWRTRVAAAPGAAARETVDDGSVLEASGASFIQGLSDAVVGHAHGVAKLTQAGWHFGASRHRDGAELFQVLWELELLEAVVLHAAERCAEHGGETASASDGLRVARSIQRANALLARAAAKGHTHAWMLAQRRHFSALRHDIRNPLGTMRNAIAFLEDDSIPPHLRDLQRYRRMIVRNAAHADALVTQHLGDVAVFEHAVGTQAVSIHEVALAVRRGLREEAREAGVEILVADELPVVRIDATTVELALLATVAGALESGTRQVRIEPDAVRERSVRIRIGADEARETRGLSLAQELARWVGGELSVENDIVLELPMSPIKSRGDLGGTRED